MVMPLISAHFVRLVFRPRVCRDPVYFPCLATQQLRELVGDGLVCRRPTGVVPAPVEYSLTEYGQSLLPLVENIRLWGRTHLEHLMSQTGTPAGDP
jgi:hypothetical protein